MAQKLAIITLGAYEQHGLHLPYETDSFIAKSIIKYLKKHYKNNLDILFLPVQEIGYSPEHSFDKKTKSLSYHQAIQNIIELAKDTPAEKILLLNTHGGNSPIMAIAAIEIRSKLNKFCSYTSWLKFNLPKTSVEVDKSLDIHGGFIETSVMLYLASNLVDMSKACNYYNKDQDYQKRYKYLSACGQHRFAWMMTDLNKDGACGNASLANAADGKLIFMNSCLSITHLIDEILTFY